MAFGYSLLFSFINYTADAISLNPSTSSFTAQPLLLRRTPSSQQSINNCIIIVISHCIASIQPALEQINSLRDPDFSNNRQGYLVRAGFGCESRTSTEQGIVQQGNTASLLASVQTQIQTGNQNTVWTMFSYSASVQTHRKTGMQNTVCTMWSLSQKGKIFYDGCCNRRQSRLKQNMFRKSTSVSREIPPRIKCKLLYINEVMEGHNYILTTILMSNSKGKLNQLPFFRGLPLKLSV